MGIKSIALVASTLIISMNVEAALFERLGGLAYYDNVLDATWLADANYAKTSGYDTDGLMTWEGANAWISSLNSSEYLEHSDWRLPNMIDIAPAGCLNANAYSGTDCGWNVQTGSASTTVYSELASLWYDTLGNIGYVDTDGNVDQAGWGLSSTGSFTNVQAFTYWFGLEYSQLTEEAWNFDLFNGKQGTVHKNTLMNAWAVADGDVFVPVPAAAWLFGSGLIGLVGMARRKA